MKSLQVDLNFVWPKPISRREPSKFSRSTFVYIGKCHPSSEAAALFQLQPLEQAERPLRLETDLENNTNIVCAPYRLSKQTLYVNNFWQHFNLKRGAGLFIECGHYSSSVASGLLANFAAFWSKTNIIGIFNIFGRSSFRQFPVGSAKSSGEHKQKIQEDLKMELFAIKVFRFDVCSIVFCFLTPANFEEEGPAQKKKDWALFMVLSSYERPLLRNRFMKT